MLACTSKHTKRGAHISRRMHGLQQKTEARSQVHRRVKTVGSDALNTLLPVVSPRVEESLAMAMAKYFVKLSCGLNCELHWLGESICWTYGHFTLLLYEVWL